MDELGETLERLIERQLVVRLERRPGQREERYRHLLGGDEVPDDEPDAIPQPAPAESFEQRLERLEHEVGELRAELRTLREQQSG